MKNIILRFGLFGVLAVLVTNADAQRTGRKRTGTNPPPTPGSTQPATQQTNNNQQPSGYNPYGNIPIVVDSTGLIDSVVKKSLRRDNAYDKSSVLERTPLPYEDLRWDDALFAEKVWRDLDLREKLNKVFVYEAEDDNGSQVFINMLMKAVKSGEVTAFADDRFTTPKGIDEINMMTEGQNDTTAQVDPLQPDKVIRYVVTKASFDAKTVTKIRIKEEWVFDREASRLFVRILGICPLKTQFIANSTVERGYTPMFWIYYPDLRPMLAKYEVYNPKNMGMGRMTWEELFESRMFSSYIVKSTLDNPSNKLIRSYIKDPILALLEGDNLKERIFNYEQDLWSY
jgi:gliding motility associated protien GldN